jgi:hypothetical protein
VLVILLALTAWGSSTGNVRIAAGDSDTAGKKAGSRRSSRVGKLLALLGAPLLRLLRRRRVRDDRDPRRRGEGRRAPALDAADDARVRVGQWLAVLASFFVVLALQLASTPSATTCSRAPSSRVRRPVRALELRVAALDLLRAAASSSSRA